jgi:hypothetical protein
MRTFAFFGAAAIAALTITSSAWAWTAEQPGQQGANGLDLSDNDKFQALQDKVNGKTTSTDSGWHFSGSVESGNTGLSGANPYGVAPLPGRNGSAFSYSPNPGFRGQGE